MDIQIISLPILFALFLFLFSLITILLRKTRNVNSSSKLPPGPWKLPLVGNMHQLVGSLPHHALCDLAKKHGPLMYLRLGQIPTIVVSSPELAKEVMKTHDTIFAFRHKTAYSEIMLYDHTDIAFAPYGEYWRQQRKICAQELLCATRVKSFKPIREEEMFCFIEWIDSNVGTTFNLTKRIHSLMYSITSRAAFGKKSRDHEMFVSAVMDTLEAAGGFELVELFPSCGRLLDLIIGGRSKMEKLRRRADRIMEDIIDDHKKKKKRNGSEGEMEEDLVDVLKYHNNSALGFSLTTNNIKAVIWVSTIMLSFLFNQ